MLGTSRMVLPGDASRNSRRRFTSSAWNISRGVASTSPTLMAGWVASMNGPVYASRGVRVRGRMEHGYMGRTSRTTAGLASLSLETRFWSGRYARSASGVKGPHAMNIEKCVSAVSDFT